MSGTGLLKGVDEAIVEAEKIGYPVMIKKLIFGARSRFLMSAVVSASCNIKLSRQLCIYLFSLAYLTVLLCDEQAPPKVSCLPVLSAVISSNGLPDSALKILPVVK